MQVSVTFRNMEPNEALRSYVHEKIAKLKRYLDTPFDVNVVVSVEKHRHTTEVTLVTNRVTINAQEETEDIFSAFDLVMDKLERQVLKHKEKIKRHKSTSSLPELSWQMNVYAAGSFDDGAEPKMIKSKKLLAKPMSVEEAAMQMDLSNYNFLIFTNANSKSLNIIYRLKDGHYGLIEPQVD